ncbi:type II toxin-antitoxin system RelE/ParE family toxin [Sphaerotilus mobilis]|uniref:Proteic killer suppression protein n=1 Tax=Sphaerotilus mobilis TaxID=47994 RepID=A0A4Q7LK07_9BURK|nr:type II toxin-antitoxin system RelE/ParE family toxin [Sphaerotilus mobilis]RZS54724.1 proteic killer suppression protein [Sphaerotilus mobilis]
MIQSFRDRDTQALFEGSCPPRFRAIQATAERKLAQLDAAQTLDFLRAPPGNRLEALKGDRAGQHSIRVNDQFRLCFMWTDTGPANVEIVDYH